jgi:hypothetical protein
VWDANDECQSCDNRRERTAVRGDDVFICAAKSAAECEDEERNEDGQSDGRNHALPMVIGTMATSAKTYGAFTVSDK